MIYDSFTYQNINGMLTWNVLIPSSLAISLFAASFYLIALGLNNVVDPRFAEHVAPERQRKFRYESERVLQVSFLVANFSNEDNRGE